MGDPFRRLDQDRYEAVNRGFAINKSDHNSHSKHNSVDVFNRKTGRRVTTLNACFTPDGKHVISTEPKAQIAWRTMRFLINLGYGAKGDTLFRLNKHYEVCDDTCLNELMSMDNEDFEMYVLARLETFEEMFFNE